MAFYEKGKVRIRYETAGTGFPLLVISGGGLNSAISYLSKGAPFTPLVELKDEYHVVAMDQRNAGRSRTAIEADHGWDTYTRDHLALMDHLGHARFHTLGGCIGGSYSFEAIEQALAK